MNKSNFLNSTHQELMMARARVAKLASKLTQEEFENLTLERQNSILRSMEATNTQFNF